MELEKKKTKKQRATRKEKQGFSVEKKPRKKGRFLVARKKGFFEQLREEKVGLWVVEENTKKKGKLERGFGRG